MHGRVAAIECVVADDLLLEAKMGVAAQLPEERRANVTFSSSSDVRIQALAVVGGLKIESRCCSPTTYQVTQQLTLKPSSELAGKLNGPRFTPCAW